MRTYVIQAWMIAHLEHLYVLADLTIFVTIFVANVTRSNLFRFVKLAKKERKYEPYNLNSIKHEETYIYVFTNQPPKRLHFYIGFNSRRNREYCVHRTSASKDAVKCDR